ncbi:MAG: hypothetical protein AAGA81_16705 [Acidobacteriota bacterium]
MDISLIAIFSVLSVLLIAVFAHLVVFGRALRRHSEQIDLLEIGLDQEQEATRSQNMLHAVALLRDKDFRTAMMVLRSRLRDVPMESWGSDSHHVLQICSTFNLVGLLVRGNLVPQQLFVQHWGQSVVDAWEVLGDFVSRKQRTTPEYCADFAYLYTLCANAQRSASPSSEMQLPADEDGRQIVGL